MLDDGSTRVLHANLLRTFVARVDSVGVIFEDDEDFGKIEYCPTTSSDVDEELTNLDLSHLSEEQRKEILSLVQKYMQICIQR